MTAQTALMLRPRVGKLIVPYMVDETRDPIDFKALDKAHVDECAERGRCGICGARIRRGPVAFIGPTDHRTCFADPWMHPACAELALEQCPFLARRRTWRDANAQVDPYRDMAIVAAVNWQSHRDRFGNWHFEAIGEVSAWPLD